MLTISTRLQVILHFSCHEEGGMVQCFTVYKDYFFTIDDDMTCLYSSHFFICLAADWFQYQVFLRKKMFYIAEPLNFASFKCRTVSDLVVSAIISETVSYCFENNRHGSAFNKLCY